MSEKGFTKRDSDEESTNFIDMDTCGRDDVIPVGLDRADEKSQQDVSRNFYGQTNGFNFIIAQAQARTRNIAS